MRISYKLILGAATPVALIWIFGLYTMRASEAKLRDVIESAAGLHATSVVGEIDRVLHDRTAEWISYTRSPLVQRVVRSSNREFEALQDKQRYIDEQELAWRAADRATTTPLMKRLLEHELSTDLRARLDALRRQYGFDVFPEVFLTNRFGANVAQTNRTTDYRQDDEDWWKHAMEDGLHMGDVELDQSAGVFSTDICVRIEDDQGTPIGVLKAVYNIRDVISILDTRSAITSSLRASHLTLLTDDGRIIHDTSRQAAFLADGSRYLEGLESSTGGEVAIRERVDETSGRQLSVSVRSPGHRALASLGWLLLAEFDADVVFRPMADLRSRNLLGALAATILAITLGGGIAVSLSRRVERLTRAARALGSGDLDHPLELRGRDELAELAGSFVEMAKSLKRSRALLEDEAREVGKRNTLLEQEATERRKAETERDEIEMELRQAQKLESVGQLAAGIAHEINTPAQYVGDNLEFLEQSFGEIGGLLKKYRELQEAAERGDVSPELISEVGEAACAADVEFLEEEIPQSLAQSREGIGRVTKIVRAMKEFSHPGSQEKQPTELNRAIESTITVARSEWKYVAELDMDLDPELPLVPCLVGEFNQVVLNIVVNAAHAIAEGAEDDEMGRIRIRTSREGDDWAVLEISDNGPGLAEEIRDKIFDPFFTTKDVGKGTGQGLAIARSVVVDKHQGMIEVESEVGQGTTFRIRLPLGRDQAPG